MTPSWIFPPGVHRLPAPDLWENRKTGELTLTEIGWDPTAQEVSVLATLGWVRVTRRRAHDED